MVYHIFIFILITFSYIQLHANEWIPLGFEGKSVHCITVNPVDKNIVFAGIKDEGIYGTTNAGTTWDLLYKTQNVINCITIDRFNLKNIYAGYSDGMIISNLGGSSFYKVILENKINVNSILLDETPSKAIIISTSKGLYKSFDNGNTFVKAGLNNLSITCTAIDNSRNKAILYAGTASAGVFKSENYGTSWAPINNGLNNLKIFSLLCNMRKPTFLLLGTLEENVYKSENSGESWINLNINNKLNQGYVFTQAIDNTNNNLVIFLTSLSGDVYKISNGSTLEKLSDPLNNVYGTCISVSNIIPSTLYLGTTTGLYKFEE